MILSIDALLLIARPWTLACIIADFRKAGDKSYENSKIETKAMAVLVGEVGPDEAERLIARAEKGE